jgi:hypothetical protein
MENQVLVSPLRQCTITSVGFGQGFLSKQQYDNTNSTDQSAADFHPFPQLKSAIKGKTHL